jgi:toxin ParE1/3/4
MTGRRVFTRQKALEDTSEIYSYIAERNLSAAGAFLDALEAAAATLSETPEIGSPRYLDHPELRGMRFYPLKRFQNYLLFYRILESEDAVEIIRIVHGARDLPSLFGKEEKPE